MISARFVCGWELSGYITATVGAMSVGTHQIELHRVGYGVLTTIENVAARQRTVVNLAMIPYSSLSDSGSFHVTSNPSGALVYLAECQDISPRLPVFRS